MPRRPDDAMMTDELANYPTRAGSTRHELSPKGGSPGADVGSHWRSTEAPTHHGFDETRNS